MLVVVAYQATAAEVERLQQCLRCLDSRIGYALVINAWRRDTAAEALSEGADLVIRNSGNLGYGRALNKAIQRLGDGLPLVAALNTDLQWESGCFETMLAWMQEHPDVVLAVPGIRSRDPQRSLQQLAKRDPTLLALFSRRFLPDGIKPAWLRRYDARYVMADLDYEQVFEAPYLSGCCMVMRLDAFRAVGGFDERFFLYLEDADLTRRLRGHGRCVHLPLVSVVHAWGRGSHHSLWLTWVNLVSAFTYFRKWGLKWI